MAVSAAANRILNRTVNMGLGLALTTQHNRKRTNGTRVVSNFRPVYKDRSTGLDSVNFHMVQGNKMATINSNNNDNKIALHSPIISNDPAL